MSEDLNKKEMKLNDFKDYLKLQNMLDVLIQVGVIDENEMNGNKICCLFHDEKTPSLAIMEEHAYCYGCGFHGDIISFIEKLYDFSFVQALSFIADQMNIKLVIGSYNPFLNNNVSTTKLEKEWQVYLANANDKSLDDNIKDKMKSFFPLEIGYDKNLNYFVFRYTSKANKTLGFTKRRAFDLKENDNEIEYPKWKHSSTKNSNIAECSNIFNLGNSIKYIRDKKEVILVEGPKDIIPFLLNNQKNVVAISGVHNKTKIFETLPELNNIILSLDSDEAGYKGMKDMAFFLCNTYSLNNIKYIDYNGKDPYDFYYEIDKKLPKEQDILNIFNDDELKKLYDICSEFNKEKIIIYYSSKNNLSYSQSKSYFNMGNQKEINKIEKTKEIEKLVKSKEDNSVRKLSLKYDM